MIGRIEQLVKNLPQEIDAVLITSEVNRLYYTGLQSSAGTLLITKDGQSYFIVDFRYIEKAKAIIKDCQVELQSKLTGQLNQLISKHNINKIALETDYLSVSEYLRMKEQLKTQLVLDTYVNQQIKCQRMIKSQKEIDLIRQAQKITDDAFAYICGYIKPGMTDRQIAGKLLDFCYCHGSQRPAFDFIVVSGKNSSMPHGVPTDKVVEEGDFITMDYGCTIDGYCSDMTRTVGIGKISDEQKLIYDTVLAAHKAAILAAKAGVSCRQVDKTARDIIQQAGYGACFGHGTGHSLGIEIHESPAFSTADETICEPGMVMTVEPGIYVEGKYGCRTENMIVITPDGCENLTASPSDLILL